MGFLTRAFSLLLFIFVAGAAAAQPTGRIEGRVLDGSTREPIPTAQVSVTGHAGDVWTDADGRFVVTGVSLGAHTVVVTRDGFTPLSQPVSAKLRLKIVVSPVRSRVSPPTSLFFSRT